MAEEFLSRRRMLKGAGLAGAVGLAAAAPMIALGPGVAGAESDRSSDAIEGAWRGTASINVGGSVSFGIHFIFAAGGGAVSSGSIDLAPNFLSTPAYGAWKRTGSGKYAFNFFFFTFDSKGNPSGSGQAKGDDLTLDEDRLSGTLTITFFDPNDNPVATGPGRFDLKRIEAGGGD